MKNTPLIDAWRKQVSGRLAEHGAKALLARHLATKYGREERSWQTSLQNILSGRQTPNGELVLAINRWLDRQKSAADGQT